MAGRSASRERRPALSQRAVATPLLSVEGLRAVLVTAEELSFQRAAERMFLSTSGLSRRILAVERALQLSLFERNSRAVRLTAAGQAFLPQAAAAVAAVELGAAAAHEAAREAAAHVRVVR